MRPQQYLSNIVEVYTNKLNT